MASGYFNSFYLLFVMRVLLGIIESSCNPLAFSLVRDLFPAYLRSTAQSILTSSIYMGQAVSSLSILLIETSGWRGSYIITGFIGLVTAIVVIVGIKEPSRG